MASAVHTFLRLRFLGVSPRGEKALARSKNAGADLEAGEEGSGGAGLLRGAAAATRRDACAGLPGPLAVAAKRGRVRAITYRSPAPVMCVFMALPA